MKRFVIVLTLLSALSLTLVHCKLDNENSIKQIVDLELTGWSLPDEAKVSTPFNLAVSSKTESTCYGKIIFVKDSLQGENYVYARSLYQDNGDGCSPQITSRDSTLKITINAVGKKYYYLRKDGKWNKDSIQIIP